MMMSAQRPATFADLPAMWGIRTRAVRHTCASHYAQHVIDMMCATPPPASMRALIGTGGALVAEEGGQMLGYAILDVATGEVHAVFVEPAHQGRGIALRLLDGLQAIAAERRLTRLFLSSSLNAVPFYQRAGFVVLRDEVYPHRSGIGIPSVFMEKTLI